MAALWTHLYIETLSRSLLVDLSSTMIPWGETFSATFWGFFLLALACPGQTKREGLFNSISNFMHSVGLQLCNLDFLQVLIITPQTQTSEFFYEGPFFCMFKRKNSHPLSDFKPISVIVISLKVQAWLWNAKATEHFVSFAKQTKRF